MNSINKVAVIGAGLMGGGIASHIANSRTEVILLDMVSSTGKNRNKISETALKNLYKSEPASFMHKSFGKYITPGNLEDDLGLLSECDWICEAVIENLEIKQSLYKKIDINKSNESIVTSNTSTIPLHNLVEGLSEKFQSNFAITHFFNPPRYMRLLEIVCGEKTNTKLIKNLIEFADIKLGKEVVICKDTPGFIANRLGIFWSMIATQAAYDLGLSIEEADAIVGKPMGVPKTGIFGLMDLTGIDLKDYVLTSMQKSLPKSDAFHKHYKTDHPLNELTDRMVSKGYTGRKGKGGFYRLIRNEKDKFKEAINLQNGEYASIKTPSMESIGNAKNGLLALVETKDKGGSYAYTVLINILKYAADLVPEISDDIHSIDIAMKAGYAWKFGPFEQIDQLGTEWFRKALKNENLEIPKLIEIANGRPFYREHNNKKQYLKLSGEYSDLDYAEDLWQLYDFKRGKIPIISNRSASIWDIGDDVACLEFHSKMNSIDAETLSIIKQAAKIDKKGFKALVIGSDSSNFSVGANVGLALFAANTAMWPLLDQTFKEGQDAYMALKYSSIPVVSAVSGMALGGGCEVCLHSDAIQAHSESYMGLIEVGVGLIPGWGGTKEMIMRHFKNSKRAGGPMPAIRAAFETIGLAKVSKSAMEAKDLLFITGDHGITMNRKRLLADAKKLALKLSNNYTPPSRDEEINLPGRSAKTAIELATGDLARLGKISNYDLVVTRELANILSGGDTDYTEKVSENDLLKLELKSIARLIKNHPTLDRIEHMLKTGKPLRN